MNSLVLLIPALLALAAGGLVLSVVVAGRRRHENDPGPAPPVPPPPEANLTQDTGLRAEGEVHVDALSEVNEPRARPSLSPVEYDFLVRLAFKFLGRGFWVEAANEFQKAADLTDDRESRLRLQVEIGNAFRRQRSYDQARAAYERALGLATGELLRSHLVRTIGELEQKQPTSTAPR